MLDCKSHLHPWHFDAKLQWHRLSLAWMQTMNFSTQFDISLRTAIGIQEVVPSDFSAQPRGSTRMSDATEPVEATNYPGHIWTKVPRHEAKSAQINMSKPSKQNTSTFLDIVSSIQSDMYCDILSGILSDILFGLLSGICMWHSTWHFGPGILSDIHLTFFLVLQLAL